MRAVCHVCHVSCLHTSIHDFPRPGLTQAWLHSFPPGTRPAAPASPRRGQRQPVRTPATAPLPHSVRWFLASSFLLALGCRRVATPRSSPLYPAKFTTTPLRRLCFVLGAVELFDRGTPAGLKAEGVVRASAPLVPRASRRRASSGQCCAVQRLCFLGVLRVVFSRGMGGVHGAARRFDLAPAHALAIPSHLWLPAPRASLDPVCARPCTSLGVPSLCSWSSSVPCAPRVSLADMCGT